MIMCNDIGVIERATVVIFQSYPNYLQLNSKSSLLLVDTDRNTHTKQDIRNIKKLKL